MRLICAGKSLKVGQGLTYRFPLPLGRFSILGPLGFLLGLPLSFSYSVRLCSSWLSLSIQGCSMSGLPGANPGYNLNLLGCQEDVCSICIYLLLGFTWPINGAFNESLWLAPKGLVAFHRQIPMRQQDFVIFQAIAGSDMVILRSLLPMLPSIEAFRPSPFQCGLLRPDPSSAHDRSLHTHNLQGCCYERG